MISNILEWYERATTTDRSEGLGWYQYARLQCQELADRYNVDVKRVVWAVAAMSPLLKWETNIAAAEALLNGATSYPAVFGTNIEKALHILFDGDGEGWERWLQGSKVTSFAKNIYGSTEDVTVDTWAWRIWAGVDGRAKPPSLKKLYWDIAADYREAAAIVGLEARQLQAITWVTMRKHVNGRAAPGQLAFDI